MSWGFNPGTVEAVATAVAALIAAPTLVIAVSQQRAHYVSERRAQARLVSCQTLLWESTKHDDYSYHSIRITVINASTNPVTRLRPVVLVQKVEGEQFFADATNHTSKLVGKRGEQRRHLVSSDLRWGDLPPGETIVAIYLYAENRVHPREVGVAFRDVDGRYFTRTLEGELFEGVGFGKKLMLDTLVPTD